MHMLVPREKALEIVTAVLASSQTPLVTVGLGPQLLGFPFCEMAKPSRLFPGSTRAVCLRRKEQQIFMNPSRRWQLKQLREQSLTQAGPGPSAGPCFPLPPTHTLTAELTPVSPRGPRRLPSPRVFFGALRLPPGGFLRPQRERRNIFLNQKGKQCLCVSEVARSQGPETVAHGSSQTAGALRDVVMATK